MAKPKYTFQQFKTEYPDDGACLSAIMDMRYGGTDIVCPACNRTTKIQPDSQAPRLRLPMVRTPRIPLRRHHL